MADGPEVKKSKLDNNVRETNETFVSIQDQSESRSFQTEIDIGITQYISDHPGFHGILKQRYSDFLVNEITPNGDVVHLTDISMPTALERDTNDSEADCPAIDKFLTADQLQRVNLMVSGRLPVKISCDVSSEKAEARSEDDTAAQSEGGKLQLPEESSTNKQQKSIDEGQKSINEEQNSIDDEQKQAWKVARSKTITKEKPSVSVDVTDSDKTFRSEFHKAIRVNFPKLTSTTETNEETKTKTIVISHKNSGADPRANRRWPENRGRYLHFVLYKENMDTLDAVSRLTKILKSRNEIFSYAGTKDKRAKTSQMISVHNYTAMRMYHLNKILKGMKVGNFSYQHQPLKLGDLKGNYFTIVLRSVTGSQDQIETAMASLKNRGFINFYGMQRFGTTILPTHEIGKVLLQEKWLQAINLILMPKLDDSKEDEARQEWQNSSNAESAFKLLSRYSSPDKQLLSGLAAMCGKDYLGALARLPRKLRHLYLHSYQSRIWNIMASKRIEIYKLNPVPGDLVLDGNDQDGFDKVKCLTEENIDNYTIYDVVLPLPGYSVSYPENLMLQHYKDLLELDGFTISQDLFKLKNKEYRLPGGYRLLLVKPGEVSYSVVKYSDTTRTLCLSDSDRLNQIQLQDDNGAGDKVALKIHLSLPSSCYATMAIREILKIDTSAFCQTQLTKNVAQ